MEPVRNHRSKAVVDASRLHRARERKLRGATLIEGPHLLTEALTAGVEVQTVFYLDTDEQSASTVKKHQLRGTPVDSQALERLAGTRTPRGPVCVVRIPEPLQPIPENLLVSWGVSDPGNVGTMIRIARAFGWGFGYTEGTADPWSPKVLRAAAGNQFSTALVSVGDVEELRTLGLSPVAAVVSQGVEPTSLAGRRVAVLIGEEASGLPPDVVGVSDTKLTVPMPGGAESLNAGVAAGIIVYEIAKHTGDS